MPKFLIKMGQESNPLFVAPKLDRRNHLHVHAHTQTHTHPHNVLFQTYTHTATAFLLYKLRLTVRIAVQFGVASQSERDQPYVREGAHFRPVKIVEAQTERAQYRKP